MQINVKKTHLLVIVDLLEEIGGFITKYRHTSPHLWDIHHQISIKQIPSNKTNKGRRWRMSKKVEKQTYVLVFNPR